MLTITHRLALQLKTLMRRAFGTRGPGPAVCFTVAAGMLNVKAKSHDIAVEYSEPGDGPDQTLWVPSQFLDDCSAKRDEPVHVEATGKGRVTAQWHDGAVPKCVRYDCKPPADADKFPTWPETVAENPPSFLRAFSEASETTDPGSVRYALGCLRLRGDDGSLAATDGRQLLIARGFPLPWTGDVLVPHTKLFACAELPSDQRVQIGKTEKWLSFGIGPWRIHLRIEQDGRFPNVEQIIRPAEEAAGVCRFSATDVQFLAETLPRLPVDVTNDFRVTLDLNGQVALRAQTAEQPRPTEVLLHGTSWSGEPMRVNLNGRQLARAVKLGLSELSIFGDESPVAWHGEHHTYVSAPLPKDAFVEPADDAIRIESPMNGASAIPIPPPQPIAERNSHPMSEPITNHGNGQTSGHTTTNNQAKTNGQARKTGQDMDGLIRQAEALRSAQREHLVKTSELLKALKRHRRQSRALQTTIALLWQLKGLGV